MGFFDWLLPAAAAPMIDEMQSQAHNAERGLQNEAIAKNESLQREFAQHGIRWRVEDARAAGINPLAALGAPGVSFSPISVGGGSAPGGSFDFAQTMGQDLFRSILSKATGGERADSLANLQLESAKLGVENQQLQNQMLASKIGQMNSMPPPMPDIGLSGVNASSGSGPFGVQDKPLERVVSEPGRPAKEVGAIPDFNFARTETGYTPVPSKDVKERIEDMTIPEMQWSIRNMIAPATGQMKPPPKSWLPKGAKEWIYNPTKGEFQDDRTFSDSFYGYFKKRYNWLP